LTELESSDVGSELKKLGYWNELYSKENYFGTGQTILANSAKELIDKYHFQKILELGCGQGRDSVFFAKYGYDVTATDISENAINFVKKIKNESNLKNLNLFVHDTKKPFDFLNKKFDLIYSNLALQFFNLSQLDSIFFNISNLMNDDSLFLFSTKKPGDKYFNFGNKISDHAFEYKGITRFFFDKSELEDVLKNYFNIIFLQDDKHVNQDGTESVWWKILVKK
jgi:tellurite methyltransferase